MCEKNVSDKMHKIKKYEGKMQKIGYRTNLLLQNQVKQVGQS